MSGALSDLRVIDFCWVGAGALVTKLLAEHGADVIKIESRARPDNLRVAPPYRPGREGLDGSGYFASRNNDKRSFALNMSKPPARELALRSRSGMRRDHEQLPAGSDGALGARLRGAAASSTRRSIYLSMPMQGSSGPHRDFIGFGATIAALSGLVELSGQPSRDPVGTGTHYPDHVPSPGHALVALLAAIRQRARTGRGRLIELSQLESTVNLLGPAILAASTGAGPFVRSGNRVATHSPSAVFRCGGEDQWCAIAARDDREWRSLAHVLGRRTWPTMRASPRSPTASSTRTRWRPSSPRRSPPGTAGSSPVLSRRRAFRRGRCSRAPT